MSDFTGKKRSFGNGCARDTVGWYCCNQPQGPLARTLSNLSCNLSYTTSRINCLLSGPISSQSPWLYLNLQQIVLTSDHCPWPYSIVIAGSDLTFSKHHSRSLLPLSLTLPVVVSICWTDTPGRMMACTGNRAAPIWPPELTRRGTGVDIMGGTLAMGRLRGNTSLKRTHWPLHNGHSSPVTPFGELALCIFLEAGPVNVSQIKYNVSSIIFGQQTFRHRLFCMLHSERLQIVFITN